MSKTTSFSQKFTLNCNGKILDLSTHKIMGILNVSPDSFYDGGKYTNQTAGLKQVEKMLKQGADIIDVGGVSSRPGSMPVDEATEIQRVIPVIKLLRATFPDIFISVDTVRAGVAKKAVEEGAVIVNDISAGTMDAKFLETVAQLKVPYILMHMQGTPKTMQQNPVYENVTNNIMDFFQAKIKILKQMNIYDIIIDPGFGFGKTLEHNYKILEQLDYFKIFKLPILVGISRKSMICKLLKINPEQALNATSVLNTIALLKGANILRVHDIKEAKEIINILNYIS